MDPTILIKCRPDFLVYTPNGFGIALVADAKAGAIEINDQMRGFFSLAAQSKSNTVVYFVPQAGAVTSAIKDLAKKYNVKVVEVVVP